jgi:hypothetical protein
MGKFPKIVVIRDLSDMDNTTVCKTPLGTKTAGDADVTDPPVTDKVLHGEANDALAVQVKRQTDQSKSLTALGNVLAGKVRVSYAEDAAYVEMIANKVVRTTGSYDAGVNVVERCGYMIKDKSEPHPRGFEVVDSGPGWIHLRVKSVGKRAGYLWRCGITPEKDVKPTSFLPILFTLQCEVVIMGLKSGSMYGFQSASIVPVAQTKNSDPSKSISAKKATTSVATKANKTTITITEDPYQWSEFIYQGMK